MLFRRKVAEEGAGRDARLGGDVFDGCRGDAALGEQPQGGLVDLARGLLATTLTKTERRITAGLGM